MVARNATSAVPAPASARPIMESTAARRHRCCPARAGFSLVECVVAAVLLSIAVLSVATGGAAALRMLATFEREQGALVAGAAVLDSLAQRPAAGAGTIHRPPFRIAWDAVDTAGGLVRVRVAVQPIGSGADTILSLGVLTLPPLPWWLP
jgi:prepilin-type N-terminal cleavage/methylation domain-containing protein